MTAVSHTLPGRSSPAGEPTVLVRRQGLAGRITLNRPRALNTLDEPMLGAIETALADWRHDPGVRLVILDAAGTRAFCAGGDIAAVHGRVLSGDSAGARSHCAREYALDAVIAGYPKPVVVLMDGVTMGGGIGLASHASHPVVTERSTVAMPECVIGWIPDSGASLLLARMPGHLGDWLALTGEKIGAHDAISLGLARHLVASRDLETLVERLCQDGETAALSDMEETPAPGSLLSSQARVDAVFASVGVPAALSRLDGIRDGGDADPDAAWASRTAAAIRKASPLSLALALAAIGKARAQGTLEAALACELSIVSRLLSHEDFAEGIRAAMIDRDRKPVWHHAHDHVFKAEELAGFLDSSR
ncbi:enoyl-CoA hydratase/isomerase family protein [Stappia sp.]|uniref:enoyl-CoA hydratase/isomerase family protein n=1 Tax=Stappia sp. TaxID=1870903 RepID=UPI003A9977C7